MKDDTRTKTEKETRKDAKTMKFSMSPFLAQGTKKTGVPSFVCYFGHMWLIACHTVSKTQTPSNRHTWQCFVPNRAHFCAKDAKKFLQCVCVYIYIEHIPATGIPWSWNTAEISLPTHTPKVCVCVPISFSKQLWKLLYCLHSNRKGSGKCLMRGRCDKRDRAVKPGNLGKNEIK